MRLVFRRKVKKISTNFLQETSSNFYRIFLEYSLGAMCCDLI
jgi:hypothetical protein